MIPLQHKTTQHIIGVSLLFTKSETRATIAPIVMCPQDVTALIQDDRKGAGPHGSSALGRRVEGIAFISGERPRDSQPQNSTPETQSLPCLSTGWQRPEPKTPSRVQNAQTTATAARLSSPDSLSAPFLLRPRRA